MTETDPKEETISEAPIGEEKNAIITTKNTQESQSSNNSKKTDSSQNIAGDVDTESAENRKLNSISTECYGNNHLQYTKFSFCSV